MKCSKNHYVSGDICPICSEVLRQPKVKTQGIKKVSEKRQKQVAEYSHKKKIFLSENPQCAVYPHLKAIEIHHIKGKLGSLFLDETWWLPVSRAGHNWIHANELEAEKLGFIFSRGQKIDDEV